MDGIARIVVNLAPVDQNYPQPCNNNPRTHSVHKKRFRYDDTAFCFDSGSLNNVHVREKEFMKLPVLFRLFLFVTALFLSAAACIDAPLPDDKNNFNASNNPKNCTDYCKPNERTCLDKQHSVECVVNQNGCLDFSNPTRCDDGFICSDGICIADDSECDDECALGDLPRCNVNGLRESCADHMGTGCLRYGAPTQCAPDTYCDTRSGECITPQCEDECIEGEKTCELHRISTCKKDARGCLSFVGAQECDTGKTCSAGTCISVHTCISECNDNDMICSLDGAARICGDWNNNGCFEFSEPFACAANEICHEGDCVAANRCQDQCLPGETICLGNKIATCGDYNSDGCVEFDTPRNCPAPGATCQFIGNKSVCHASPQSGSVLINEIFYDALGDDLREPAGTKCKNGSPSCTSPTFVELIGPPGLLIAGYRLEMINGATGKSYNTAELPTDARLDGKGYAVIAMEQADSFLSYAAPFSTNLYYILKSYAPNEDAIQNGAGSIVLYDAARQQADAVGYGDFSASNLQNFRGRGQPAARALSGRSLGRIAGRLPTDNNASDFITFYPTPGMPNQDLLINEIYVNQPGANDGTETFVELVAPILGWEDLSLSGYVLRAVAGHNGKDYLYTGTIPGIVLDGKLLNDTASTDGYVVLCNKKARQALHSLCSVHYDGPPFYTGPDNFILEYQQHAIDAIGYGTFAQSDTFAGEGRPAPYDFTDSGRSLARGSYSASNSNPDTNDNAADFQRVSPTPGTGNARP